MSQAVRDLPDPLEPAPSLSISNPDDLLAKMADDAIDQLMAAADKGMPPAVPPPIDLFPAGPQSASNEAATEVVTEPAGESPTSADEEPSASEADAAASEANKPAVTMSAIGEATAASLTTDEDHANADTSTSEQVEPHHEPAAAPAETPPVPAADMKALLADDTADKPSILLLPLQWLNAPFAGLSEGTRSRLGLLALVTLVPAVCAIVWVLFLKPR